MTVTQHNVDNATTWLSSSWLALWITDAITNWPWVNIAAMITALWTTIVMVIKLVLIFRAWRKGRGANTISGILNK